MIRTSTIKAIFVLLLLATPTANATVLGFEEAFFSHGTIVEDQYDINSPGGVHISAINTNGTNTAVIFDSREGGTEDWDLEGTFTNINNAGLPDNFDPGNILIIQEDLTSNGGCDATSCVSPDDEGSNPAGTLIFKFDNPVKLTSLDFFDIEKNDAENNGKPGHDIQFFDQDGLTELFASVDIPGTGGDKTWDRLVFAGITGIYELHVNLGGSGAIDRLDYSVVPVPAAFWLFGTALIGFIGFSRRTSI